MKPKFNIEDYEHLSEIAMCCPNEEDATIFFEYLNSVGKRWCNGEKYVVNDFSLKYGASTAYAFNRGKFCSKEYYEEEGYTFLYFDDFDWCDGLDITEKDIKAFDKFFASFAVNT